MDKSEALSLFKKRLNERKFYRALETAYDWQKDFMSGGSQYLKRMLMAGNRTGKTWVASLEVAIHATGLYPGWWTGKRFDHAPLIWISSLTNETLRDIMQLELLGKPGEFGTGMIPAEQLHDWDFRQAGIKNVVDTFRVKHTSGDLCTVKTKVAEQGWERYQGTAPDFFWQDEEPADFSVLTESFTRLMTTRGSFILTFTPLRGETLVVQHFMEENKPQRKVYTATWDDALHLDDATKKDFLSEYPEHERETRSRGIPMMGEGAVFPIADEEITCDPFEIPAYYPQICGVDFGWDHPAAGVWLALDIDKDVLYLVDAYKQAEQFVSFHASAIKHRDPMSFIPVVWPHDGINSEKGTGTNVMLEYQREGVNMFPFSARYDDDVGSTQKIEPVVQEIYTRMKEGRFKVFNNAGGQLFLTEKRGLYRKDNKIKAIADDIFAATRYAVMMLRYATPQYLQQPGSGKKRKPVFASSRA